MTRNLGDPATITTEMAVQIRAWRVDEGFSWRAVAQAASELWGSAYGSNQLYGEDLCAAAAQMLGENPCKEPWN
jgi:outer membrane protein assembly factor BamD (BamD/ComL family)